MRVLISSIFVLSTLLSTAVFSFEENVYEVESEYEYDSILHDMFIGCAATKTECRQMAHHQGYTTSKTIKDRARCPQRPKTLACIVKHIDQ